MRFKLLITLCLLMLCNISFAQNEKEVILSDNFSDNKNGWTIGTVKDAFFSIEQKYGRYVFKNKKKYSCQTSAIPIEINTSRDFEIEAIIKKSTNIVQPFGLVWGRENYDNSIKFLVWTPIISGGSYKILKVSNGVFYDIQPQTKSPYINVGLDIKNKFTIKKIGNKIKFYINDKFLVEKPFEPFMGNQIGFVTYKRQRIDIYSLKVSYLDEAKIFDQFTNAQDKIWSLIMTKNDDYQENWYKDINFPNSKIKEKWAENYRIKKLSYGAGEWVLVMNKPTDKVPPEMYRHKEEFPEKDIQEYRAKGYNITNLTFGNGRWALVMQETNSYPEVHFLSDNFPNNYPDYWAQDYRIKHIAYGNGKWALVMTKKNAFAEVIRIRDYFPKDDIKELKKQGYSTTFLNYGNKKWVLVMQKRENKPEKYLTSTSFPKDKIKEYWNKGYTIKDLTYCTLSEPINIAKNDPPKKTSQPTSRPKTTKQQPQTAPTQKPVVKPPVYISDVDKNIPVNSIKNETTFAVVIGNETYNKEIKVSYAVNDAKVFKQYLTKTLGLPNRNIHYMENATYGQILDAMSWINDIMKVYSGESKIIFYYAGHGMPSEKTKNAYLLPVDGNSQNPATAIKLTDVYNTLTEYPSKSVYVFLDACFSGATREANGTMLAKGRGVRIKPKDDVLSGNIVVLSAASGNETAFPYAEKQHGLFTYFLLKKLQESKGEANLKSLIDFIKTNVSRQSVVVNRKQQTPQINSGSEFKDKWEDLRLK